MWQWRNNDAICIFMNSLQVFGAVGIRLMRGCGPRMFLNTVMSTFKPQHGGQGRCTFVYIEGAINISEKITLNIWSMEAWTLTIIEAGSKTPEVSEVLHLIHWKRVVHHHFPTWRTTLETSEVLYLRLSSWVCAWLSTITHLNGFIQRACEWFWKFFLGSSTFPPEKIQRLSPSDHKTSPSEKQKLNTSHDWKICFEKATKKKLKC